MSSTIRVKAMQVSQPGRRVWWRNYIPEFERETKKKERERERNNDRSIEPLQLPLFCASVCLMSHKMGKCTMSDCFFQIRENLCVTYLNNFQWTKINFSPTFYPYLNLIIIFFINNFLRKISNVLKKEREKERYKYIYVRSRYNSCIYLIYLFNLPIKFCFTIKIY